MNAPAFRTPLVDRLREAFESGRKYETDDGFTASLAFGPTSRRMIARVKKPSGEEDVGAADDVSDAAQRCAQWIVEERTARIREKFGSAA